MKDERLNDLLVLACGEDLTDNIDLNAFLRTWAGVKITGKEEELNFR